MATITFLGRNDDWENLDNWDTHALPVNDDKVIIPEEARSNLTRHVDRGFLDLWSLWVHPGYKGNIGSEGAPLKLMIAGAPGYYGPCLLMNGSGTVHLSPTWGTGPLVVNSPGNRRALVVGGEKNITSLSIVAGDVELRSDYAPAAGMDVFMVGAPNRGIGRGGRNAKQGPTLIDRSAAGILKLVLQSGNVEYHGDIQTIRMNGGHLTAHPSSSTNEVYMNGGRFIYNATPDPLGALTLLGGLVDTTQTSAAKEIIGLYRAREGTLLRSSNLTVTNEFTIFDVPTD